MPMLIKARAVQQTRDAYEIQKRIPAELVGRLAALGPESESVWALAKGRRRFRKFQALSGADAGDQH